MNLIVFLVVLILVGLVVLVYRYLTRKRRALKIFQKAWNYHVSLDWSSTLATINKCIGDGEDELMGKYQVLNDLVSSLTEYTSDLITNITQEISVSSKPMSYLANDLFSAKVDELIALYAVTDTTFRDNLVGLHAYRLKSKDRIFTMDQLEVITTLKNTACLIETDD